VSEQFHFDPASYGEMVRAELPDYERFQDAVAGATDGVVARRVLDLGTGTGETARRVVRHHPGVGLVAFDESEAMLAEARSVLPDAEFVVARLQDPLPRGPFDLVTSALAVHHLDPGEKADLFRRVAAVLAPGGRFVLGDVVVPDDPADAVTPIEPGVDLPDRVDDQLRWLGEAGLDARVVWSARDLVVVCAERPSR